MKEYYHKTIPEIYEELKTSEKGLSEGEVNNRFKRYGYNEITSHKRESVISIFVRQFKSFLVWILFLTATISAFIGHEVEAIVILVIIMFIVLLNFFMEFKASKEMDSLIKLAPKKSKVLRNGKAIYIDSKELVPGDIIFFNRGDIVGADARVVEVNDLAIDESALTGESVAIHKDNIVLEGNVNLAQRINMLYSGTPVTNGNGIGVIVSTGDNTEFGKISKLIGDVEKQKTPLQKRLDKLSKHIAFFAFTVAMFAYFIGLVRGIDWLDMIIFSMAIIVSGIPESLPTAVGICLAFGVKKMSKENAIVKSLPAVETLGTCSVICTDKTGTLTQNKMIVEKLFTINSEVEVTGEGYIPDGHFIKNNKNINILDNEEVVKLISIGALCNNAILNQEKEEWIIDGNPTEGALITLTQKAGILKDELNSGYTRLKEHAFDANRKMMSIIHEHKGKKYVHTKGASEFVLEKSDFYLDGNQIKKLNKEKRHIFLKQNRKYASKGYRVIGFAYKECKEIVSQKNAENKLIFVGMVAIRDPPDPLTYDAIRKCKEAGITPIMITGDNKLTAIAIGKELGIYTDEDNVLTGEELDKIVNEKEEKEFLKIINTVRIFARTTPEHKLQIVNCLQKKGHIVAMTGDGINDAPALKQANIGVAMGLRGSEVAKESSDLILKDDKFSTIVKAVESGRNIFNNIRKFIYYLLVGSVSEVLLIVLALIIASMIPNVNLPLTALMILFINLVTSEFPAIGLSLEKSNPNIMKKKPRDPKENILNEFVILRIFSTVPVIVLGTLLLYVATVNSANAQKAQTITFITIILFELFHAYNTKSWNQSIFNKNIFSNKVLNVGVLVSLTAALLVIYVPTLQNIFGTVPLTEWTDWVVILIVSSSILLFVELKKYTLKVEMHEKKKLELQH
jgi:P-type Ca2+ transporter type 2C